MSSSTTAAASTHYTVSQRAYAKIVLHAAAHACVSVNGVLLADTASLNTASITVTDAVPLFHTRLTLSPMLEIALEQLDIYCEKTEQTIIGYYQANEALDAVGLTPVGAQIASRIRDYQPGAFAVVVDNNKLSLSQPSNALIFHTMRDNQWIVARNQPDTTGATDSQKTDAKNPSFQLESPVSNQLHRQLVDFDTHLASVYRWLHNNNIVASLGN
ncbi:hypothetical protein BDF22DRAFT_700684 [Syncephalis plumigaleata]|nr:hypothetical protein BDF22DRAFT_700684 [Syncephalis plumigaleata]